VIISKKLNRWGNKFDFVQYCDVKNVFKLESELDSIHIGIVKLYVNLPRYRKHDGYKQAMSTPQGLKNKQKTQQGKVGQQWRVKGGNQKQSQSSIRKGIS